MRRRAFKVGTIKRPLLTQSVSHFVHSGSAMTNLDEAVLHPVYSREPLPAGTIVYAARLRKGKIELFGDSRLFFSAFSREAHHEGVSD